MKKEQLLKKAKELNYNDKIPKFKGIYIIPREKLHDSGFKCMHIIGHTEFNARKNDFEYYLLSSYSDVVDFQSKIDELLKDINNTCDLHLDINPDGIIHIWTNSDKYLHPLYLHTSNMWLTVEN